MRDKDTNTIFDTLMGRPNIERAAQKYEKMSLEIRRELMKALPELPSWIKSIESNSSGCGSAYPGIEFDGQERDLDSYRVNVNIPDEKWKRALDTTRKVAERYGFDPAAQRLHDGTGDHDAAFHNRHDGSEVTLGTAKRSVLGVTVGCHLTLEAKKRGHPSGS